MYTMQRLSVNRDDPLYKYAMTYMEHSWGTTGKNIFPGSQPVSIEYRHFKLLASNPYVVCEKTDGVRFMMLAFMFENKKQCVFLNRALEMFVCPLNFRKSVYDGTILEGEMYGDTFMIYDILIACGEVVGNTDFLARLKSVEGVKKMLTSLKYDPIKLKIKTFHLMSDYKQFKDIWKMYVQERGKLMFESEIHVNQVPPHAREWMEEDAIIECQYMFTDEPMWWKPIIRRYDKTFPNGRRTFYRTLVNIKENISIDDFMNCIP